MDPGTFARIRGSSHKILLACRLAYLPWSLLHNAPCDATLEDGWRRKLQVKVLHCEPYDMERRDEMEYAACYFRANSEVPLRVLTIMVTRL